MQMTLLLSIMHKLSKISLYFSERYDTTSHVELFSQIHYPLIEF
jgi:hypothetical protein